ncbi:MAG TPA: tyrosine-type recombinase/integrase [Clostridiaceae bacterium]
MEVTLKELKTHKKAQLENKLKSHEHYDDSGFICCWDNGKPFRPPHISGLFRKSVKKLDYPKIRFHDLRHTHATMLLSQGVNPKIVSERL